mmetsp:Transcript_45325/g.107507  ORF Transcript_45325/g.107507 Transcript_45325/m.107507 type:complete len:238 (+) Transcript_45325:1694-2407(+)
MRRSLPLRLNTACGTVCTVNRRSPASLSGDSSLCCSKVMTWPSGIPFSTSTSTVSEPPCTFFPLHLPHACEIILPLPPHSLHAVCICCTNPGAICCRTTRTPDPPHALHRFRSSGFRAPEPPHWRQTICFLTRSSMLLPRYRSRSVTSRSRSTLGPFSCPCPPPRRPPNMLENMSKGFPPPCPRCSCRFSPSSPCVSKILRFSLSDSTSYAAETSENISFAAGSLFLSGWYLRESLR